MLITQIEKDIFALIDRCKFGSVRGIDLGDQDPSIESILSPNRIRFINAVRKGLSYIDILKYHESEPVLIVLKSKPHFADDNEQLITLTRN